MPEVPEPVRPAVMIDIDRERDHWRHRYQSLPRARAMRSFARYWPVLCAAYDVYLNHPRVEPGEGLALFLRRESVALSLLSEAEAGQVFAHVWERIRDATSAGPRNL